MPASNTYTMAPSTGVEAAVTVPEIAWVTGAAVTVRVVLPVMKRSAKVALMVLVPALRPVARPAASIVATAVSFENQVTKLVRSDVKPSLRMPVAVNCWVAPASMDGSAGVTVMLTRVGSVTVIVKLAAPTLSAASATLHSTVVVPTTNMAPEPVSQAGVSGPSTRSDAVAL